jgi:hypothetical protein
VAASLVIPRSAATKDPVVGLSDVGEEPFESLETRARDGHATDAAAHHRLKWLRVEEGIERVTHGVCDGVASDRTDGSSISSALPAF